MADLIALLFVSLRSNSSDPESDDGDDQAARDTVSSLQRRASLAALKEGREPEEHSPELCGLGVGRGSTTHDVASALFVICHSVASKQDAGQQTHGRKSERTASSCHFRYLKNEQNPSRINTKSDLKCFEIRIWW